MASSTIQKDSSKKKSDGAGVVADAKTIMIGVCVIFSAMLLKRNFSYSGDPLIHMIPNAMLWTPFAGATKTMWKLVLKYGSEPIEPSPIPEMDYKDFTHEKLRVMTENFRSPAIVRGMFLGTPGVEKWPEPGYLSSKPLGEHYIPVIADANYGTDQKTRVAMTFGDAIDEVLTDEESTKYLFFPVQSRAHWNLSNIGNGPELVNEVNSILREDLELDRIFKGFGSKDHKAYIGGQIVAGQGREDTGKTTGSFWHCAVGNNWFVQVAGTKRWYFLDQKYSAYMQPMRDGVFSFKSGTDEIYDLQKYLPIKYVDIRAGDMLYNPDWQWHTIKNYKGLTIGCPLREKTGRIAAQNNAQFTFIILFNQVLQKFGIFYGG